MYLKLNSDITELIYTVTETAERILNNYSCLISDSF